MTNNNQFASKIAQIKAQLQAELAAKEVANATIETATPEEVAEFLDMMQEVDAKQAEEIAIKEAQAIQAARYKKVKKYDSLLEEIWG